MAKHRVEKTRGRAQRAKENLGARRQFKRENLNGRAGTERAMQRLERVKKTGDVEKYKRQIQHEIALVKGRNEKLRSVTDRTRMQKITDATRHPFNLQNRLDRINSKHERRDNRKYLSGTDRSRTERLVDYLRNPRLENRRKAVEKKLTRREILDDIRRVTGDNSHRKPGRLGGERKLSKLLGDALATTAGATAETASKTVEATKELTEAAAGGEE